MALSRAASERADNTNTWSARSETEGSRSGACFKHHVCISASDTKSTDAGAPDHSPASIPFAVN